MSMNPGATTCPVASMTRCAGPVRLLARALIRPSHMATSTVRPGVPLPSMTWAPRITRSSIVSPLASHAALGWRRGDVTAASCEVPVATATVLYGSAQGEETQHATACRLCYHQQQHLDNLRRKGLLPRLKNDRSICLLGWLFCLELCRFC